MATKKLYVGSISKKLAKQFVEEGTWTIEDTIAFFVFNPYNGNTVKVYGAGEYGTYGEEGTKVEIINAKNGNTMFNGEIIEYASLGDTPKGVKTYFLD